MKLDPLSQPHEWPFRRVMWATLVFIFVAFSFWLLYRFIQVVFILFIAIVIGTVIRPAVFWLHQRGLPRMAAVILVCLLLLALLTGFVLLLFPLIVEQSTTIATSAPSYYQSVREWMINTSNPLMVRLSEFLPATLPNLQPAQQSGEQVLASAGQALGVVRSGASILFVLIATVLLALHWTLDGQRIIQSLLLLLPMDRRESIGDLIAAMESKVGFYIVGQGVLCLFVGVMALVAYLLIGLPNALVLGLLAGVLEAVPMIGPLLGAIPAALVALSIAPSKLLWVVVATLVIQQVENAVLVPRVMRKAVGVNPFVSLLAIFAFSSFFGIAGALMAIPMAAIIQLLFERFLFHRAALESEVSTGRDYASRLRYEAQDLARDLRKQTRLNRAGSPPEVKETDRVMDEIEAITIDLDALLAQVRPAGAA